MITTKGKSIQHSVLLYTLCEMIALRAVVPFLWCFTGSLFSARGAVRATCN